MVFRSLKVIFSKFCRIWMDYDVVALNWFTGNHQNGVIMVDQDRGMVGNHRMVPRELLSGDGIHVIVNEKRDHIFTHQFYYWKHRMENMFQFKKRDYDLRKDRLRRHLRKVVWGHHIQVKGQMKGQIKLIRS